MRASPGLGPGLAEYSKTRAGFGYFPGGGGFAADHGGKPDTRHDRSDREPPAVLIFKRPGKKTEVRFMWGCLFWSLLLSLILTVLVNVLIRLL
jgi:hypothetical protein